MPGADGVRAPAPPPAPASPPGAARGVGLIEILVAVLLLSIGFLAVARMQVQGMRISQDAYHRSQAYFLAADMIDRMRSNVPGVLAGHYDDLKTAKDLADPGCAAKSCSASELAAQDRHDWSEHLHPAAGDRVAALPSSDVATARGEISTVAGTDGLYTVTLYWNETIGGADSEQSLAMNFATEIPQ